MDPILYLLYKVIQKQKQFIFEKELVDNIFIHHNENITHLNAEIEYYPGKDDDWFVSNTKNYKIIKPTNIFTKQNT